MRSPLNFFANGVYKPLELKLELILIEIAQKPMLRAEVYVRALHKLDEARRSHMMAIVQRQV
jgi:hypothetical protein